MVLADQKIHILGGFKNIHIGLSYFLEPSVDFLTVPDGV